MQKPLPQRIKHPRLFGAVALMSADAGTMIKSEMINIIFILARLFIFRYHSTRDTDESMTLTTYPPQAMMALIAGSVATFAAVPPHHPQHRAPRALLDRIAKTNPAALAGAGGVPGAAARASKQVKQGYRVSPSALGADPTGRTDRCGRRYGTTVATEPSCGVGEMG